MASLIRHIFIFLFSILSCESGAQIMWQFNKDTVVTWYYSDGDEFNSNKLNTNYWDCYFGWARSIYGNKEQQYYSEGENHRMEDGLLKLDANINPVVKKVVDWRDDNDSIMDNGKFNELNKRAFKYTAGCIQSKKTFTYGYFEIKFKMPAKNGYWPAFWMAGGSPNEEIDMMELKTEKKNKIHVGRHSTKREENRLRDGLSKKTWGEWVKFKGDLSAGYNVVAGEWTTDYIKYYLNGECIAYTALSLNHPKNLIANIAVPANNGPFKPGPADSIVHSGDFEIDYIRIWTKDKTPSASANNFAAGNPGTKRNLDTTSLISKRKFTYGKKSRS